MKIAIVAPSPVPFVLGGAERLVKGLTDHINDSTEHDAELIKLPSREHNLPDLMATYEAFSTLDLTHFDVVVSTKYPSWMIDHPCHVVYMLHPLRGLYDQYPVDWPIEVARGERAIDRLLDELGSPYRGRFAHLPIFARWKECLDSLGRGHPALVFPGPLSRALIRRLDQLALSPQRTVGHHAISRTVAERAGYFPVGVRARAVIPPSGLSGFRSGHHRSFFTASRLDHPKRIELIIRAMGHVRGDVPLTIAGTGPASEDLRRLAAADPRITFAGHISDEQLLDLYADALAVPFVPIEEDLGYITIEAMRSGTPVITCADSGGPTELVHDGQTGYVVEPTPEALGEAMDRLAADRLLAHQLGENGRLLTEQITWQAVVDALLAGTGRRRAAPGHRRDAMSTRTRPHVIVLATYPAVPQVHGGQLRIFQLCAALAERCDVTYICLDTTGGPAGTTQPHPGLTQIVVARTPAFNEADGAYNLPIGLPVTDICASLEWATIPEVARTIQQQARTADLAILAQPYFLPALQQVAPQLPFVYDSQNAEFAMKSELLGSSAAASELVAVVEEVERRAVRSAELVVTCSPSDREQLQTLGPTLASWADVPNGGEVLDTRFVTGDERHIARRAWLSRYAGVSGHNYEHVALFVASYHPPNLTAAEAIARIAPELPDVLFVLAGGHAQHFTHWQLPANVLPRGYVPRAELRRLLSLASVGLNPMISGGGSNLKLIEYFAAGTPVISTSFGARGYDVHDGVHLRLADNDDLADAISELLTDPTADERAARARWFAETACDWSVLGDHFTTALWAALERLTPGRWAATGSDG